MKIILSGSLGHISRPLTQELVTQGHEVTVISSKAGKQAEIEVLGAKAAIGSLEDRDFLTQTFTGADAVYTMVPPANYFDQELDLNAYYHRLGNNYAAVIKASGVKQVVNLSTIGAHLEKGSGILIGAHDVEGILNALPAEVAIVHMRPTSFFYNLFAHTYSIKNEERIAANYGVGDIIPWVSPVDIAAAIAEEIGQLFTGRKIRYVCSEELSGPQTAAILSPALGKPVEWVLISDEETLQGMVQVGMNPRIAAGLVEMFAGLHTGLLSEDYFKHRPVLGKTKMAAYAKEFAAALNNN